MEKKKTIERIYLSKSELIDIENDIRFHEHLKRYAAIRRYCYGTVLDFACGCGYGSYLISKNPDVTNVIGADIDDNALDWAKSEYCEDNISFINSGKTLIDFKVDTLISLETIEHIEDKSIIPNLIEKCDADNIILCFPDKKSTHFNKFHYHDFVVQDIIEMFPNHVNYYGFRSSDVQFLMFLKKPKAAPSHIFRYLYDVR